MENPFRYGEIVTGRAFTDRRTELAELTADIHNGQNVVIISPRRYGKTSLVFQAIDGLKREGVLVAYLDMFRTPSKDRLATHLAQSIYGGLVAPFGRLWQRATDVFRNLPLNPKITINQDGAPSFEFAPGERERDVDQAIEALLGLPGQIAQERQRRVAFVIDEFQQAVDIDPHLPAVMRAVFQLQTEVAHVFLGSRQHLLQRVFTAENEPMYRLAKPLPLRAIPAADFAEFIASQFASSGQRITGEAVERILTATGCHPHDTQELSYFTWEMARSEGAPAGASTVVRALERVIDAEDARYTTLWEGLSPYRRLVLLSVASAGGNGIYSQEYRRQHRLGAASSVQRAMAYLLENDLVESTPDGAYHVPDAFLRAWLQRLSVSQPIKRP
ncbi:MAG: hypothetical protein M1401_14190 [Chloroflexi bacterium]|nr:hypothetical protein [Chloroflexota bacterium]